MLESDFDREIKKLKEKNWYYWKYLKTKLKKNYIICRISKIRTIKGLKINMRYFIVSISSSPWYKNIYMTFSLNSFGLSYSIQGSLYICITIISQEIDFLCRSSLLHKYEAKHILTDIHSQYASFSKYSIKKRSQYSKWIAKISMISSWPNPLVFFLMFLLLLFIVIITTCDVLK